jgi:oligoendopeptidase F
MITHSFLPNWSKIEQQLNNLVKTDLHDDNLDEWLVRWSDVKCEMNDAWLLLLRSASLDTSDKQAESELKVLTDNYNPIFWKYEEELFSKVNGLTGKTEFSHKVLSEVKKEVAIFSQQNTPLFQAESALQSDYEVAVSRITVKTGFEELTTQVAQTRLISTEDRNERFNLWKRISDAYLEHRQRFAEIYLQLCETRQSIAHNVGFHSYREFTWKELQRSGYSPDDTSHLLDMIAEEFEPIVSRKTFREARLLGLETLRPWDTNLVLDQDLRRRTLTQEEMISASRDALALIDASFGAHVDDLKARRAIDLMSRENKRPFTQAIGLSATGVGYINGNLAGHPLDQTILLHEIGHTIHYRYCLPNKVYWTKIPTQEVMETVAFFFQYAGTQFLANAGMFTQKEAKLLSHYVHDEIVSGLQRVSNSERFQHWVFQNSHKDLSVDVLDEGYLRVVKLGNVDWTGYVDILRTQWQMRPHIFSYPFRDSAYAVAWIAVLQLLHNFKKNPRESLIRLEEMMALGNTATIPQSFGTLGLRFPFDRESVRVARMTLEEQFTTE